jgi:hypothetical protein
MNVAFPTTGASPQFQQAASSKQQAASSKQQAASSKQQDRMSRRTAFRDTRNLRQVCLIGCPSWKYARRIFAIVSTTDMPELLSEVPRASWSPS